MCKATSWFKERLDHTHDNHRDLYNPLGPWSPSTLPELLPGREYILSFWVRVLQFILGLRLGQITIKGCWC